MAEDLIETHSVFSHALVSFSIGEYSTSTVLNYNLGPSSEWAGGAGGGEEGWRVSAPIGAATVRESEEVTLSMPASLIVLHGVRAVLAASIYVINLKRLLNQLTQVLI